MLHSYFSNDGRILREAERGGGVKGLPLRFSFYLIFFFNLLEKFRLPLAGGQGGGGGKALMALPLRRKKFRLPSLSTVKFNGNIGY